MDTLRDVSVEMNAYISEYNNHDTTDERREELELLLDGLEIDFKEKVRMLDDIREYYQSQAIRSKAEADRMKERSEQFSNKAQRTEEFIDRCMKIAGVEKLDTGFHKISYRASSAVIVTDPTKIPQELCKYVPERWDPAKTLIGDAIKAGQVIEGAYIEHRKNLQIK